MRCPALALAHTAGAAAETARGYGAVSEGGGQERVRCRSSRDCEGAVSEGVGSRRG